MFIVRMKCSISVGVIFRPFEFDDALYMTSSAQKTEYSELKNG